MNSPNITTYLMTKVDIHPKQMNNDIRANIKQNLIDKLTLPRPKCFAHYGVVLEIHEISYAPDAEIIAEDASCSAKYNVKFLCTLCHPLNKSTIVGYIDGINQMVIHVINGPLDILINTVRNVNTNVFKFNNKIRHWTVQKDTSPDATAEEQKRHIIVKEGTHVKVTILSKKIIDRSERIVCLGYLDGLATDEEARSSMKKFGNAKTVDDINNYISKNNFDEGESDSEKDGDEEGKDEEDAGEEQ